MGHIEDMIARNLARKTAPGRVSVPAEETISSAELKQLQWERGDRDQRLVKKAEQVIATLDGQKFDVNKLEAIYKIYSGYFHKPAILAGYKPVKKGGQLTGEYILNEEQITRRQGSEIEKLKEENEELKKFDKMYADNFSRQADELMVLEDENEKLKLQLAKKTNQVAHK